MALIACPNPSCSHEVVNNWPSCPKCHCPVQVLLAAAAAKAREEYEAAAAEAELEEAKPSGKMLQRLKETARDDDGGYDDAELEEVTQRLPRSPRGDLVAQAGLGVAGLGGVAALGIVATLDQPGMATFLAITAVVCFAAGYGLNQLAETMTSSS
jgi:hypothetical protein